MELTTVQGFIKYGNFASNLINEVSQNQNLMPQGPQFGGGIGDNSFFSDEAMEEQGPHGMNLNLNGLLGGEQQDIFQQIKDLKNENKQLKLQDSELANNQQSKESELKTKEAELQELEQKQQEKQQNDPFSSLLGNKNNNIVHENIKKYSKIY